MWNSPGFPLPLPFSLSPFPLISTTRRKLVLTIFVSGSSPHWKHPNRSPDDGQDARLRFHDDTDDDYEFDWPSDCSSLTSEDFDTASVDVFPGEEEADSMEGMDDVDTTHVVVVDVGN